MLATPVVPSSWFISVSSTNVESSSVSFPFWSIATTAIGIMLGLIFMMDGEPMESSQFPDTISTFCKASTTAVSMLAPFSNSRTTME